MTFGLFNRNILGGLAFRVLLFLSLTLLPIGLISVIQTREISKQSTLNAQLFLLNVTERAAETERNILQQALGSVHALSSVVDLLHEDTATCMEFLQRYQSKGLSGVVTGFLGLDAQISCTSTGQTYDMSAFDAATGLLSNEQRAITFLSTSAMSNDPAVIVSAPVFQDAVLIGQLVMSIPLTLLEGVLGEEGPGAPLSLFTFNRGGDLLTSEKGWEDGLAEMPRDYQLEQLSGETRQVFEASNQDGILRIYAVLPIVPNTVFAMSVWPSNTPVLNTTLSSRINGMLPVIMWIASLVVAFWALNRLAIKHIRSLVLKMRYFALNRTLPRFQMRDGVPNEIVEMEDSFLRMAESILRDEAAQEDNLRDRNILLKEVHHRVKNNLQLISSIMNMQIRQAKDEGSRDVLKRLQDRILSLATVHKSLYQGNELRNVDGSLLLKEIVNQSLVVGMPPGHNIEVAQDYDQVQIDPDDAAPITLLVSEAITNAMKYVHPDSKGAARINVSLKYTKPEHAVLEITNTTKPSLSDTGTGLGSRLIQAFARQLEGTLEVTTEAESYTLTLDFPIPEKEKLVLDY